MISALASAALLGLTAVSAAPWGPPGNGGHGSGSGSSSGGQVPFKFPLANGFPNVANGSEALAAIEIQAHGTLPNGPPATSLQSGDVTVFELIAFNELFEVAFFTSLIYNITHHVSGFDTPQAFAFLDNLIVIQGVEELHALGANGILAAAGHTTIQPCEYVFPSDSFESAIQFAATFTDIVLSTLQDGQAALITNGDPGFVPLLGSIQAEEGGQEGGFREILGGSLSEVPFFTRGAPQFAFSALNQMVIVPGSCPNENLINLPIFGALTVVKQPDGADNQELEFTFKNNGTDLHDVSITYLNQQNVPVTLPIQVVSDSNNEVTIKADFPGATFDMFGFTIAALTQGNGPFATSDDVAKATLFGPGVIEVDQTSFGPL